MKKLFVIALSLICFAGFSQEAEEENKNKELFTFGVDLFHDIWLDLPENMDANAILPGTNIIGTYNFYLGESNFSFSTGLNLGMHNLKNNTLPGLDSLSNTIFTPIEGDTTFKKSKLNLTYLDIPMEIRFATKQGFKCALGFKYGFLLNNKWKYKGEDYLNGLEDEVIYKFGNVKNMEQNRYGFVARVGYKKVSLFGFYPISNLFITDKGPEMTPISVGISYLPFD